MNEEKFREGVRLFNERKFFECHDLFEEIWMNEDGSEGEFFRGLIHLAVGSYHVNNRNYRGAKSQLIKGVQKLEPYEPEYLGIRLTPLLESFRSVILDIERVIQGQLSHEQIGEIPLFEYISEE